MASRPTRMLPRGLPRPNVSELSELINRSRFLRHTIGWYNRKCR